MEINNLIVGPCSFETFEDTKETVKFLTGLGIKNIRGGAKKYRSIPKDYQGTEEVYTWIAELKKDYDFNFVNEIYSPEHVEIPEIDTIQIGSRNCFNTYLLKGINGVNKPVILKRHFASSLNSFVDHAGYLDKSDVILCLRGIMGLFPQEQRFMPDVTDIARLRKIMEERGLFDEHNDPLKVKDIKYKYKICYDVSHSACHSDYVKDLVKCAAIYKPDYIMIETHPKPMRALSDAQQQIDFRTFEEWFKDGLFQ
jgi:3-deoxy-D-arabino-heptulosonate 7-phosphate (DAHP) synthase